MDIFLGIDYKPLDTFHGLALVCKLGLCDFFPLSDWSDKVENPFHRPWSKLEQDTAEYTCYNDLDRLGLILHGLGESPDQ